MNLEITVNGTLHQLQAPPLRRLLDILRQDLGLTGTKEGCGEGECGACAVFLDGELVNSCLVPAFQAQGSCVVTIEGVGSPAVPDPIQEAFLEEGAVQCGFCIPGMVIASRALLDRVASPDETAIREGLAGNLCRCTGYEKIVRAVQRAAEGGPKRVRSGPGHQSLPPLARCRAPETPPRGASIHLPPSDPQVIRPLLLDEAVRILSAHGEEITPVAGSTDFMTGLQLGARPPVRILDLSRISELGAIEWDDRGVVLGAGVTLSRILSDDRLGERFPALRQAAAQFGAPAIRNRATIGGNLLSASPAADLPPALWVLDAEVRLASARGLREIPLRGFYAGYRQTVRRPDELLAGIRLPWVHRPDRQRFYKIGPRQAQAIAKVSLACRGEIDAAGEVLSCRFAAGSVAPVVIELPGTSGFLLGRRITEEIIREAGRIAAGEVQPIDDVRSTAHYRKTITGRLVARFLREELGA